MTPTERRQRLLEVLCVRRHDTCSNLAHEFHVAKSTIHRDLDILTCSYPIETVRAATAVGLRLRMGTTSTAKCFLPSRLHFSKG